MVAQEANLNSTKIFGFRKETPVLIYIPVNRTEILNFTCENLIDGLFLDNKNGIITGSVKDAGLYKIPIKITGEKTSIADTLEILIGNNLTPAPVMGWNTWNVFADSINETLIKEMADAMISTGMRDAGYAYINLDDFWHAPDRNVNSEPLADSIKFTSGIKELSDYLHERGLKLGIYSCAGNLTCGKCFGGYAHEKKDAETYASWGIDLLKYDYCHAPYTARKAKERYNKMGTSLKNTNRSIVFSICEWGLRKPWKWGNTVHGHYWRITPDIFDVWDNHPIWHYSVMAILRKSRKTAQFYKSGGWNDMDMLIVGNYGKGKATSAKGKYDGLTDTEYESHMIFWCLYNSPLIAGCDIRNMNDRTKSILLNQELIKINQQHFTPPRYIGKNKSVEMYLKKITESEYLVCYLNLSKKQRVLELNNQYFPFIPTSIEHVLSRKNFDMSKSTLIEPHQTILIRIRK